MHCCASASASVCRPSDAHAYARLLHSSLTPGRSAMASVRCCTAPLKSDLVTSFSASCFSSCLLFCLCRRRCCSKPVAPDADGLVKSKSTKKLEADIERLHKELAETKESYKLRLALMMFQMTYTGLPSLNDKRWAGSRMIWSCRWTWRGRSR